MSDAFAVFGALVALSAPIVAGPLGFVEPEHAIVLGQSERAGRSASAPAFYAGGEEMGRLGTDNPTVTFEDLPETFVKALIAVEDRHFEQHMGVDPVGVSRAVAGIATGRFAGGGSTLSQQLAKNVITGARQTIDRKIEEAYSAVVTETLAGKEEILESYANAVFFRAALAGGGPGGAELVRQGMGPAQPVGKCLPRGCPPGPVCARSPPQSRARRCAAQPCAQPHGAGRLHHR